MITTTLDSIVRRALLESNVSIHWYGEYLFHAATCLRELSFDSLQLINSANLPTDETASVQLPGDFVDDLAVCIPSGQSLSKLPKQDWITPLRLNSSTTGAFVPYDGNSDDNENGETVWGYPFGGFTFFWNVDAYGEGLGGNYGSKGGTSSGYKLIREQRRIQLTEDFISTNVVLLYISDGQSIDAASQITPMAWAAIQSYIEWKRSANKNNDFSPEGRAFYNQRRLLRARLNDLDVTTIKNIIRNNYSATVKG